ncbi:MAG: RecX family transcriptional regulator [bacterium]|nr:RecX family transcriptional regulator [bacterium]
MAPTITAFTIQKRNKERVNLFLDGEYAFSLSLNTILGLQRGQCLSQVEIDTLRRKDEILQAYHAALRLLGYRPRSQVEMRRRLQRKGYGPETVSAALQRLADKHYLDDDAFARYWLEQRQRSRPRGARAIDYELRQRGVDKDIIDQVLNDLDEEASAWAAIEGKLNRWRALDQAAFRKKAMGLLSRRGFSYDIVRHTCRKAWESMTALQDE